MLSKNIKIGDCEHSAMIYPRAYCFVLIDIKIIYFGKTDRYQVNFPILTKNNHKHKNQDLEFGYSVWLKKITKAVNVE